MIVRDVASVGILLFMLVVGAAGYLAKDHYESDGPIEELVESVVEDALEDTLKLPDGTLEDKIDFTFWDEEGQLQAELMKEQDL